MSARAFYGLILAGLVLGVAGAALGGWAYLEAGDRQPTGRRIWDGIAGTFVIPVAVMMGATFGGLVGFAVAAVLDRRARRHNSG